MVQWLRLHVPNSGDTNSISGRGTKTLYVLGIAKIKLNLKIL